MSEPNDDRGDLAPDGAAEPDAAATAASGEVDAAAEPAGSTAESSDDGPALSVEQLLDSLEQAVRERDEYLALAQRTQADFENHRKLAQRRVEDEVQRVTGGLVERLLPVLDACDGAVSHGVAEVEPIAAALLLVLEKEGLTRIDPIGEPFDPTVADAVVHEPGAGGDHVVSEVLRAGYAWHGRTLRPAMVKVTD